MLRSTLLISLASLAIARPALADQCSYVEKATADAAKDRLLKAGTVIPFCEPCGETAPGAPDKVEVVEVKKEGGNHWQVYMNGHGIDLAYIYVPTPKDTWRNLGIALNCGASDVSPVITKDGTLPPNGPTPKNNGPAPKKPKK